MKQPSGRLLTRKPGVEGMAATTDTTTAACCGPTGICPVDAPQAPVENSLAGFFGSLFDTSSYPARWNCGEWTPLEGWLHIVSDVGIFLAYLAIPSALVYCMFKRRDVPFHKILVLFAAFILFCGAGHLLEAVLFYFPIYRVVGLLKFTNAIVSWVTAIVLIRMLPQLLDLPSLVTRNELLEKAARTKTEFLANMSHEIRTPMTAILGYADILADGRDGAGPDPSSHARAIKTIQQNGAHLLAVLNDILDMSKIEANRIEVERLPTRLVPLLDEVAGLLGERAEEKNLSLRITYASQLPETVFTDPTRLRQILLNLVGNALKFTFAGGVVLRVMFVSQGAQRGKIRISVVDTGIGLPPDQLKAIRAFEPFVQADNSMTRRFGGTGLGLTISESLTRLLGGKINVESEQGVGSTFSFTFDPGDLREARWITPNELNQPEPKRPPSDAPLSPATYDEGSPLKGRKVLLVEDGPDNQRLFSFLLERAGAEVDLASNGREGIDCVSQQAANGTPHDVILMDMQMPVLDGYAAMQELRDAGYTGTIIALTAHALPEDRQRCLDAGADDYLSKPIDRKELIALCQSYCEDEPAVADESTLAGGVS